MRALVKGRVYVDGRIKAEVVEIEPGEGPRPRGVEDVPGADPAVLKRIQDRVPGVFKTWCWPGGATAICAPWGGLLTLPAPLVGKLVVKYGLWEPDVFLMEVRNTGAPHIQNVAEFSGGMAESANLPLEAMLETVEMGFSLDDGWASFDVSALAKEDYSAEVLAEQELWWGIAQPGFPRKYTLRLEPMSIGKDTLDGRQGVISARVEGDFSLLIGARVALEPGSGWKLRDLESHEEQDGRVLVLDRKITAVANRRLGRSPIMFEFDKAGGLDECGLHVALSHEAVELNISHLGRQWFGPHGLGWLRPW